MNKHYAKPALSVIAAAVIAALVTSPSFAFDRQEEALAAVEPTLTALPVSGWNQYSGTAPPGSSVHKLIQSTVSVAVTYPVKFSIRVEGAASELFAEVGVDQFAESLMVTATKSHRDATTTRSTSQPTVPFISPPLEDAVITGSAKGCTGALFGVPPQPALVNYSWEWRQYNSNKSGELDESDEYGWQLTNFSAMFPPDIRSLPSC